MKALDRFTEFVIVFCLGVFIGYLCNNKKVNNSQTPVEENRIDSLTKVNDSIKITIEHLDSVKNAEIIEVSTLDNDSTIKLFYKLISK